MNVGEERKGTALDNSLNRHWNRDEIGTGLVTGERKPNVNITVKRKISTYNAAVNGGIRKRKVGQGGNKGRKGREEGKRRGQRQGKAGRAHGLYMITETARNNASKWTTSKRKPQRQKK